MANRERMATMSSLGGVKSIIPVLIGSVALMMTGYGVALSVFVKRLGGGHHPDFLKLWAGQTISLFGSLIGRVALPLVAVLALEASPAQVALLYVSEMAP